MRKTTLHITLFLFFVTCLCGQGNYIPVLYSSCETDTSIVITGIQKVEILAFGTEEGFVTEEGAKPYWPSIDQIDDYSIDESHVLQKESLKSGDIEKLKLLLSKSPRAQSGKEWSGCFTPRHAIIMRDKDNGIKEIIELCFECGTVKIKKDHLKLETFCKETFEAMRQLFLNYGVDFNLK